MIDTNELRQRKAALVKDARAILDAASGAKRELTAEEKEKVDKMVVGAETLAAQLALEERLQKQDLDNAVVAEARDKAKVHGEFRSLAEFINAVRFNGADPRLVERRTEEVLAQMGDNAQGGYLVPPQFQAGILQVKPEDAIVRPRAQVIPAGFPPDSTLYIPALDQATYGMYGGVSVSWIEEGGAKPETKPKFDRVELTPHEVAATIPVTDKLLRNSAAFDPLARNLLRGAILATEDMAFLNGAVGGPTGLIGHASNILVARETAGDVTYQDIRNMYASQLMGGAYVWIISQTVLPALMAMEDGGGHLIWQPNAVQGAPGQLLGLPCIPTGRTPVLGTQGDVILADLKYYLVKDGSGIFLDASPHFRFTENITIIKITWNVDGIPWPTGPFTLEDGATQVSPFVVLDLAS
jgi:HK97 family phage major capsid protein